MTFWEFYSEHPVLGTIVVIAALVALLLTLVFLEAFHTRRVLAKLGGRQ